MPEGAIRDRAGVVWRTTDRLMRGITFAYDICTTYAVGGSIDQESQEVIAREWPALADLKSILDDGAYYKRGGRPHPACSQPPTPPNIGDLMRRIAALNLGFNAAMREYIRTLCLQPPPVMKVLELSGILEVEIFRLETDFATGFPVANPAIPQNEIVFRLYSESGELLNGLRTIPEVSLGVPRAVPPQITVDIRGSRVTIQGSRGSVSYTVTPNQAAIFAALVKTFGGVRSAAEMGKDDPNLVGVKVGREVEKLQPELRTLVGSNRKGYFLDREQVSSLARAV